MCHWWNPNLPTTTGCDGSKGGHVGRKQIRHPPDIQDWRQGQKEPDHSKGSLPVGLPQNRERQRVTREIQSGFALQNADHRHARRHDRRLRVLGEDQVAFVGLNRKDLLIQPVRHINERQLTIHGSVIYGIDEFEEIGLFVVNQKVPIEKIVSDVFRVADAAKAFTLFDRAETAGKIVFTWE